MRYRILLLLLVFCLPHIYHINCVDGPRQKHEARYVQHEQLIEFARVPHLHSFAVDFNAEKLVYFVFELLVVGEFLAAIR